MSRISRTPHSFIHPAGSIVSSPPPPAIDSRSLCDTLAALADRTAAEGPWRSGACAALAEAGILAAFVPVEHGGTAVAESAIIPTLVAIAERCLTTALALTQWAAAVRIIAAGPPAVRLAHMNAGPAFPPACKGATWCRSAGSLESGRVGREDDMFAVGCCVAAMATGVVDREKGIKGHFANSPPLIQASGPLVAARPS
jgi:hypothetical protein